MTDLLSHPLIRKYFGDIYYGPQTPEHRDEVMSLRILTAMQAQIKQGEKYLRISVGPQEKDINFHEETATFDFWDKLHFEHLRLPQGFQPPKDEGKKPCLHPYFGVMELEGRMRCIGCGEIMETNPPSSEDKKICKSHWCDGCKSYLAHKNDPIRKCECGCHNPGCTNDGQYGQACCPKSPAAPEKSWTAGMPNPPKPPIGTYKPAVPLDAIKDNEKSLKPPQEAAKSAESQEYDRLLNERVDKMNLTQGLHRMSPPDQVAPLAQEVEQKINEIKLKLWKMGKANIGEAVALGKDLHELVDLARRTVR